MSKMEIDFDSLSWWGKLLLFWILTAEQDPEELKRYAELAGIEEPRELEDKKPLG